jgi:hypothetical protein
MHVGLLLVTLLGLGVEPTPLVLDSKHQLLLDDFLIASRQNLVRTVHPAEKHSGNPLLRATEPWEGETATVYGSVLRDGGRYRMWYHVAEGVAYAESPDGLRWTKPRLGVIRHNGQATNLVLRRKAPPGEPGAMPNYYEIFGVLRDDRDPNPSQRYKMGFLSIQRQYRGPREDPYHRNERRGLGVAGSPDGIHWRLLDNWTTEAICDGATHWCWDPTRSKYVLYGRTRYTAPEVAQRVAADAWAKGHFWGRSVARVESPDFLHWDITAPAQAPVVMTVDAEDRPGTEIYSMLVVPYESVYLGLVQLFHNRADTSYLEIELAVSRDGRRFTRVGRGTPFLPVGPVGTWDRFNNSLATNAPIPDGERLRFYYGGRNARHQPYVGPDRGERTGGIGLATVARDRFVSLSASFDGGLLVTKPLQLRGRRLHLNAKADFGQISVEVLDPRGKVLVRSKPVRADGLDLPVEWPAGTSEKLSTPVVLRITVRNALLFALWCS